MIRHIAPWTATVLLVASLVACDNKPGAIERQRGATELQKEEDTAADRAANARAAADKDYAKALVEFEMSREDYRHARRKDLADLDKKIIDLEAEAKSATADKKVELQHRLQTIHAKRGDFARELQQVDIVHESRWHATRSRLDKDWNDLKSAVEQTPKTGNVDNLPPPVLPTP